MTSICKIITKPETVLTVRLRNGKVDETVATAQEFQLLDDWQLIEIIDSEIKEIEIQSISIDNEDLGELLYTSWATDGSKRKFQPCTSLNNKFIRWSMVLHSDVSAFKERLCNQVVNGDFGKNLFEHYQWFLDLAENLSQSTNSNNLDKFMQRSQGLNLYPKHSYYLWPFISLDIPIDQLAIYEEIQNLERISAGSRSPGWSRKDYTADVLGSLELPQTKKWLADIGVAGLGHVNPALLKSRGYINLHRDFDQDHRGKYWDPHIQGMPPPERGIGIDIIHVPLLGNEQVKLKVSGGGIMPNTANLLNHAAYAHAAVNEGYNDRYVLIIYAVWTDEFVQKYLIPTEIYCNLDIA